MDKLMSSNEIKEVEKKKISTFDDEICFIERAGKASYDIVKEKYKFKKILVVCGPGKNGADGVAFANNAVSDKINVDLFFINQIVVNEYIKYELSKKEFNIITDVNFDNYDLIIDAIFGIGLNRNLEKNISNVISKINKSNANIVSLDIPSGIDSNSGMYYENFISSDLCITFSSYKIGQFLSFGLDSYKEIVKAEIGFGDIETSEKVHLLESEDFNCFIPKRHRNVNKGSFNMATIIGGSCKYSGAAILSYNALTNLLMGSGYSSLYTTEEIKKTLIGKFPEVLLNSCSLNLDGQIKFDKEMLDDLIKKSKSISVGMGMEESKELFEIVNYLLHNFKGRLVIDADAINSLAKYGINNLKHAKCTVILTPHIKEFSRLSGKKVTEILWDPIGTSLSFSRENNVILVLKSASTVVTNGDETYITNSGNSGLAKGGSGDVLSGIICGLMSYVNDNLILTAAFGTILLGLAANEAVKNSNEYSLLATNVIEKLPTIFSNFIKK